MKDPEMSQSILIIVESPTKAQKFNEMFAGRLRAMATVGHICDLPSNPVAPGIGIDRETMKGQYELTKDSNRTVDGVRVIAKFKQFLANNPGIDIYLATDPDREGESISAFVAKELKLKNPKRIRFTSITKDAIEKALASPDQIDWAAVNSREARRLIDRIIGYVASPYLYRIIKQKGAKAGRVQTAVEALVIERERKIRNHKSQTYYTVKLDMGGWVAEWQISPNGLRSGPKPNSEYDIDDPAPKCWDEAVARQIAGHRTLSVDSCEESMESRLPPSPLYTISMIQLSNRVLGWDAEKTMQVAQKLFEGDGSGHGHITYHRTDSPNIDAAAAEDIRAWLREQRLPVPQEPNTWKCKNKSAQEGHEAIRPTYFKVGDAGANEDQQQLYKLIRERAIYSQLSPARYAVKRIVLTDPVTRKHRFTSTARTLVDPGWLKTAAAKSPTMQEEDESADAASVNLPDLQRNTILNTKDSTIGKHTTKAPPRYTMNTLTAKLEKLSIGRPATIAVLLKNVQTKGTIVLRKDLKLEATKLAESCYDVLYPRFSFAHIGYTAELEQALDQIASGKLDGPAVARMVWDRLDADCSTATPSQP